MEWLRISTSTELVRVATDEIVYVRADGNYSDLVLTNGKSRKMTFPLHFFSTKQSNSFRTTYSSGLEEASSSTIAIYAIQQNTHTRNGKATSPSSCLKSNR